jgi:hypothetical protein
MYIESCLFSIDTTLLLILNWVKETPEVTDAHWVLIADGCGNLGPVWGAGGLGLQAVRTMRQQAACRYATLVLWGVMHLGSGGVRDGLENTCYSTAVCILRRGEGGCDFYADDLLLAGFLCYLTPCVCVCRLCMEREQSVPCFPFHNAFHLNQKYECTESVRCLTSGCVASFPSDDATLYHHALVKRQESVVRSFPHKTYRVVMFYLCGRMKACDAVEVVETTRVLNSELRWASCW